MTPQESIPLIEALANGIHPVSGDLLPEGTPFNERRLEVSNMGRYEQVMSIIGWGVIWLVLAAAGLAGLTGISQTIRQSNLDAVYQVKPSMAAERRNIEPRSRIYIVGTYEGCQEEAKRLGPSYDVHCYLPSHNQNERNK